MTNNNLPLTLIRSEVLTITFSFLVYLEGTNLSPIGRQVPAMSVCEHTNVP